MLFSASLGRWTCYPADDRFPRHILTQTWLAAAVESARAGNVLAAARAAARLILADMPLLLRFAQAILFWRVAQRRAHRPSAGGIGEGALAASVASAIVRSVARGGSFSFEDGSVVSGTCRTRCAAARARPKRGATNRWV